MPSKLPDFLVILSILLVGSGVGCAEGPADSLSSLPGSNSDDDNQRVCVDEDGDGYYDRSARCPQGNDCDDTDPDAGVGCVNCSKPADGCPCEEGSQPVDCSEDTVYDPDTGEKLCVKGVRFCRDGRWQECVYFTY